MCSLFTKEESVNPFSSIEGHQLVHLLCSNLFLRGRVLPDFPASPGGSSPEGRLTGKAENSKGLSLRGGGKFEKGLELLTEGHTGSSLAQSGVISI